jgi:hypothetical protein
MPIRRCQGAEAPKTTSKIVPIKNNPTRGGETSPLVLSEKLIMSEANTIQMGESTSTPLDNRQSWGRHRFAPESKKTFRTRLCI